MARSENATSNTEDTQPSAKARILTELTQEAERLGMYPPKRTSVDSIREAIMAYGDERYNDGVTDGLAIAENILVWLNPLDPPAFPDEYLKDVAKWAAVAIAKAKDKKSY